MPRPIERLFAMDEMIRSGDYPSIIDFMRRFDISERAVYGDVQYLKRHFHAPIQYSKRQGGYFYTLIGWSLAKAETPTENAQYPSPDQWLWEEIARRYGRDAAADLQYAYRVHKKGNRCPACGKILQRGRHRCLAKSPYYNVFSPGRCVRCHKPIPIQKNRRYCEDCATLTRKERMAFAKQRYQIRLREKSLHDKSSSG
jgi:hypothetical protein